MSVTKTQAIKNFLTARTHKELAELYTAGQEVQVNVAQDGGELIQGVYEGRNWRAWTDGMTTWKPFRIPLNANSDPHYEDANITWDLDVHAEGIGMTGWDWKERLSRWVAFDFDSILGHSDKHTRKLTDEELSALEKSIAGIEWVELRRSTGGRGLHLYVHLEPVATANHTEHAALARSILGKLSALTGFDFFAKVDTCGGNMWVWHRKMRNTNGLSLIKRGVRLQDIPLNWRDHISVTSGKRRKNLPQFIEEVAEADVFEELTGRRTKIPLDDKHKELIKWLQDSGACWWWDNDHHMLITHTFALREAHSVLKYKGVFETQAKGSEHGADHNCFCFPMRMGAWGVRRYTPGVEEASTWEQDGGGWTRCYLNRDPDLGTASRVSGGREHPSGGYDFRHAKQAAEAVKQLGANVNIPDLVTERHTRVKANKDNKLVFEIDAEKGDPESKMRDSGWILDKKRWTQVVNVSKSIKGEQETNFNYDDLVRHMITKQGDNYGWAIKSEGSWRYEPLEHVKKALGSCNFTKPEVDIIVGEAVFKAWNMVNYPFQPEYPGDRQWNRDAAQLKYPLKDEKGEFPTWMKILTHVGENLDDYVRKNEWCKSNAILSGADYLMCWVASLFKEPGEPLPYLFLYGPQGSGKSILHEALTLLVSRGVVRADAALASSSTFNGELEHGVLCIIEETDLRKSQSAYNRIKDWVTSRQLLIHRKQCTPYSVDNTTHWIQCSNESSACPIFPGDTRITMIFVDMLKNSVPKKEFIKLLEKEASDFLTHIMSIELPETNDRLNMPVIHTNEKMLASEANRTLLEMFLEEEIIYCRGHKIVYKDLYDKFVEWCDPSMVSKWPKTRFGRELPPHYPKGRSTDNITFVGNISTRSETEPEPNDFRYISRDGKLEKIT